jgi:hypothetical protein
MHTMKKRATRLALAGLAILMAATLAACGSDTPNPPPSPAQPAQAGPAATAPSKPTTAQPAGRPAAGSATTSSGPDFGFLRSWTTKNGTIYLRFDRAVFLTGKAADAASAAHGGESPVSNDIYIQNDNPRLREVAVLDQATVIGSQQLSGNSDPQPSSLKALLNFLSEGGPQVAATPFHLTYNANGHVIRIQEQYIP